MSTRRRKEGDSGVGNRTKTIRRVTNEASNDGSRSTRKSFSPPKPVKNTNLTSSKHNIANSIIMRRQLNALNDISPPKNSVGYSFVYDDNKPPSKGDYEYERKVLQHISKNKPKIKPPSPNKKIKRHINNKILGSTNNIRDISFNSTIRYNFNRGMWLSKHA